MSLSDLALILIFVHTVRSDSELQTFEFCQLLYDYELYARAHVRAPPSPPLKPYMPPDGPLPSAEPLRRLTGVLEGPNPKWTSWAPGPAAQVHPPTPTRRGSSTLGPAAQAHPPGHPAVHMHMQSLDAYTRPRPQPRPRPRSQPRTRHRDGDRHKDRALRR